MSDDKLIKGNGFDGLDFLDLRVLYPEELKMLEEAAQPVAFKANEPVMIEGQESNVLYLVKSGQLRVNKRHDEDVYEVGAVNPGDIFGEASILYKSTAGAEVRAIDDCELFAIPSDVVHEVFKSNDRFLRATTQLAENRAAASALAVNPIFSTLPMAVREVALYNAKFVRIKEGELILRAGDPAVFMFVILAGQVDVTIPNPNNPSEKISVATLGSGDDIGDVAIVTGLPHSGTVQAMTPVRVLAIRNSLIEAWAGRYSDFAFAIYAQVQKELNVNRHKLNEYVEDHEARKLTINLIPNLEEYKTRFNL